MQRCLTLACNLGHLSLVKSVSELGLETDRRAFVGPTELLPSVIGATLRDKNTRVV